MEFTRINNDINCNPRYVVHFVDCRPDSWDKPGMNIHKEYLRTVKLMNKIGGRKFSNKQYGGGIVFTAYDVKALEKKIQETIKEALQ